MSTKSIDSYLKNMKIKPDTKIDLALLIELMDGFAKEEYKDIDANRWIRVEDRLPVENDTCEDYYNEVLTLQLGSKRPTMMKYWEIKNSPFVKLWMPLPDKPHTFLINHQNHYHE